MAEIIDFPGQTILDVPAAKFLQAALKEDLAKCVVVGRCKDGGLYLAGNFSDAYEILWLLELAKKELMEVLEKGVGN